MAFINGRNKTCLAPDCRSTFVDLVVLEEHFDVATRAIVGTEQCSKCQARMGYSRRATPTELAIADAHLLTDPTLRTFCFPPPAAEATPVHKPRTRGSMLKPDTPMYLRDVTFGTEKLSDETKKIVTCIFMLQPFTREQAEDLNVHSELFEISTGEPKAVVESVTLHLSVPLQRMSFAKAPELKRKSLTVDNVAIGGHLKIRRDKEGPVYAATLSASFYYPSGDELLYIANGVNEQHFMTFASQQGDMLTEASDEEAQKPRRGRKRATNGSGSEIEQPLPGADNADVEGESSI